MQVGQNVLTRIFYAYKRFQFICKNGIGIRKLNKDPPTKKRAKRATKLFSSKCGKRIIFL